MNLAPDTIVQAIIYKIVRFGLYCRADEVNILVLAVDAETHNQSIEDCYSIGETIRVKIIKFHEADQLYRAVII